jgi:hypothetical protein
MSNEEEDECGAKSSSMGKAPPIADISTDDTDGGAPDVALFLSTVPGPLDS